MQYLLTKPSERFTEEEYQTFMKTANFMLEQFRKEIQRLKMLERDASAEKQEIIDQARRMNDNDKGSRAKIERDLAGDV